MENTRVATDKKFNSPNIRELSEDEVLLISGGTTSNCDLHGKHCACKTCRERHNKLAPIDRGVN
jgi:hypothetical protein